MEPRQKDAVLRYGVALLSIILAWLVRTALDPYLGNVQPFATFYIAITFVAWWAGWRPALLALILGYFAAHWFFLPPRHALALEDFADVVQHIAYFFVTGTTVLLMHSLRRAHAREAASAEAAQRKQRELENQIQQREQAEEQRRFQRQLTQSIANTAAVCIFVTDEKGRVTFMNPEAERVFGFSFAELQGRLMHDAIHHHYPDGRPFPQSECPIGKVYESGETTRSYEEFFFRKDGSTVPVVCSNAALSVAGKIVGAVLVAQDISERKGAEEALRLAKEQLACANADLERKVRERTAKLRETVEELEGFSYSLVHDLRAPLRAMQHFAALAQETCAGCAQAEGLDYFRRIRTASNRLDRLITDALNYSKVVQEELPVLPVDIGTLLRGIVETYPSFQPSPAEIQIEFETLTVLGNEAALTQVFSNLLGNAVKFVAPGVMPHIRVWAELVDRPARGLQVPAPSGYQPSTINYQLVRIWVEDNGVGISQEAHKKIFGMFQRMHREAGYPGTGIGLTIVRKALERMGGRVGVESEPGKGSRFWVELAKSLSQ